LDRAAVLVRLAWLARSRRRPQQRRRRPIKSRKWRVQRRRLARSQQQRQQLVAPRAQPRWQLQRLR